MCCWTRTNKSFSVKLTQEEHLLTFVLLRRQFLAPLPQRLDGRSRNRGREEVNKKADDDDTDDDADDEEEASQATHEEPLFPLLHHALHRAAEVVELPSLRWRHYDDPIRS